MSDAFLRLLKVLALERKQGYRNKAVIGGLDKFASRWEIDARAEASNPTAVDEIVALLLGYPSVEDFAARERIIDQIIRRIGEASPGLSSDLENWREEPLPTSGASGVTAPQAMHDAESQQSPARPESEDSARIPGESESGVRAEPTTADDAVQTPAPTNQEAVSRTSEAPAKERERSAESRAANGTEQIMPAPTKPLVTATAAPASPRAARPTTKSESPGPEAPSETKPEVSADSGRPGSRQPGSSPGAPQPHSQASAPAARTREPLSGLEAPVTRLPSVGPSLAERLGKLGVHTIRDLLYLLPTRYEDYSHLRTIDKLAYGEQVTIIGTPWGLQSRSIGDNRKIINAVVGDGTGEIQATWFNPFVERRLRTGRAYAFSGRIDSYRGRLVMRNPEFEPLEKHQVHTGRLVPIYPLTEGLSARWLRRIMDHAVNSWAAGVMDFLPEEVRRNAGLTTLGDALCQIHFPDSAERLNAAHRRLSFDEFLLLQLGMLRHRRRFRESSAHPLRISHEMLAPLFASLPFTLTASQRRAIEEIAGDMQQSQPMSRLLQGDVGSGKTAVAATTLWLSAANGFQGAIMAPTEILAEQHYRSFSELFNSLAVPQTGQPVRIALLTGSLRRSDRDAILDAIESGDIDIIVGTHALIQSDVRFHELAVVVVDEQHRFGVEQRGALRQKGVQPHVLVMSATPIPRSLALTIYGDLDITTLDEMPAGRLPVKTKWLTSSQRERAYTFIRRQVQEGRQAFIIYPLVQEDEVEDGEMSPDPVVYEVRSAVEAHRWLQEEVFPDLRLGLLHGRMRGEEKDANMRRFSAGEIDVLVATSVVEVGIDIPNASVIAVESADRFGLAQLHQFRGRVGRGQHPSFCILISDATRDDSVQRLQAMENSADGFALAQIDLEMRGPGDFFGTRQSGLPPLHAAQLGDLRTLEAARSAAQAIFAADPQLGRPEHADLAEQVDRVWAGTGDRG
jgi:ATP-dependent DNA helicase RecG